MNVVRADTNDLQGVRKLLATGGLPADDLTEASLEHFLVLRSERNVSAAVGLECFGEVALLRSLVVAPELRGTGIGAKLTDAAESLARELAIKSIYLLTTTAASFFAARGYRRIDRTDAPSQIQRTTQFSALCPSTAVLMVKP